MTFKGQLYAAVHDRDDAVLADRQAPCDSCNCFMHSRFNKTMPPKLTGLSISNIDSIPMPTMPAQAAPMTDVQALPNKRAPRRELWTTLAKGISELSQLPCADNKRSRSASGINNEIMLRWVAMNCEGFTAAPLHLECRAKEYLVHPRPNYTYDRRI